MHIGVRQSKTTNQTYNAMKIKYLILLLATAYITSCTNASRYAITPYPNHLEAKCGTFTILNAPFVCGDGLDSASKRYIADFAAHLSAVSGGVNSIAGDGSVRFEVDSTLADEAYTLNIRRKEIAVKASQRAGFIYAIQTLKQLLPVEIYGSAPSPDAKWSVPCVTIADAPRFAYRGMMLDVSRHFFSTDEVKRYIDIMAAYKLNTLHWHLSDDQGWRVEIKSFPRLTEVGSIRKKTMILKEWENYDNTPYGGFYTQEQIRDIVAYADARGITVIPEIDLPGHMMAALAAYSVLGCTGGPYDVSGQWGVRDDVLCPGKESTFKFIEGVLTEIMELFPSKYIHIGGDECPKVRWQECPACQARIKALGLTDTDKHAKEFYLQSYVTKRVEAFLNANGRQIIGWDEILEGELAPNATVMSWRGNEGGIEAAKQHHKVIMTPTSHFYFDYYQSLDTENEPFGIGGYVPVERVYSYELPQELQGEQLKYVWGIQANMWSEYITSDEQLEYMLLPRLAALSEVQWCEPTTKSWERFVENIPHNVAMYDVNGYKNAKHIYGITGKVGVNAKKECVEITLQTLGNAPIYYTLDGSQPTTSSSRYSSPIELRHAATLTAIVVRDGVESYPYVKRFTFNKATGKVATLNTAPKDKHTYTGAAILTDGLHGDANYANGTWLGFLDEPLSATIDMGKEPQSYSKITVEALVIKSDWIFNPSSITISTSDDGKHFTQVATTTIATEVATDAEGIKRYDLAMPTSTARYIKVDVGTVTQMPEWHGGKGEKAYLFVDEIEVR